ncbi:MAG: DUF378 domain-containing protein [Bacilli bacterium]
MKAIKVIALFLTIVGAINWGLISIFDFNLVEYIFNNMDKTYIKVTYTVIGISGLISLKLLPKVIKK